VVKGLLEEKVYSWYGEIYIYIYNPKWSGEKLMLELMLDDLVQK
jgi:hypothetical protein